MDSLLSNTEHKLNVFNYLTDENLGWMKGCNAGIEASEDMDYVILANDDILVPPANDWCDVMVETMEANKDIGALSCLSYNVGGWAKLSGQTALMKGPYEVPYCVFYFVMLRKEAIDKVGLLDDRMVGGDDLDYCIRLRDAGYKVAITPNVFIWHHYCQTGKRVYSDWDSEEMTFNITRGLIRKHGFSKFVYTRGL